LLHAYRLGQDNLQRGSQLASFNRAVALLAGLVLAASAGCGASGLDKVGGRHPHKGKPLAAPAPDVIERSRVSAACR